MQTSVPPSVKTHHDDSAVSEVIGFLLIFGILSMILVLSMVAFNGLHDRAKTSIVRLEAESVAQRVASSVVDAALFGERHDSNTSRYVQELDLPGFLVGRSYTVHLDSVPLQQVRVLVPSMGINVTAPLFSAGAASNVGICVTSVPGGAMRIGFGPNPPAAGNRCIYLET
jgi:hypothetical protein